jgi:ATP-binding cassette subfamily F protein uup
MIVEGLDLLLTPGMRLGVLGANGSGKTTLLRMIVGELPPDAGEIRPADELRIVYFDQNRSTLDPAVSLKRALAPDGDTVIYRERAMHVVSWAKRFLFRPEQLETPVSRLSGGERARIVLARLMLQPADLLVLDEPTNDLDIPTLEVLEESLLEFPGALVLVTHDRHLIDRVSTAILALDGRGGVHRFADYGQWEARERKPAAANTAPLTAESTQAPLRKAKKLSYLERREWDGMEESVLAAEAHLEEARLRAADPSIASNAAALQTRLAELALAQATADRLYARWAELEAKQKS